ncbi:MULTISPECIES: hypothetical protein [Kitasatospora]|uniref:Uncharacterized protein n=1 Tax=Kitasatospora cystarginea TaxID=58350 RepID=A0ABN3F015_9ACTN
MDIIVLNAPQQLQSLGSLHAALPESPRSHQPGPLTLCGRPTHGMSIVAQCSTQAGTAWYPAELAGTTARCTACAAYLDERG